VLLELTPVGGGAPVTLSTADSVIGTTSSFNQGWWSPTLGNSSDNDNYLAGALTVWSSTCTHSFFTFDLGATSGPFESARLLIADPGAGEGPSLNLHLWDVSTPAAALNATTGTSRPIYDDLGSGVSFGSYLVDPKAMPAELALDPAAVSAINAGSGYFSIGVSLTD
jgi:hypothetical protein